MVKAREHTHIDTHTESQTPEEFDLPRDVDDHPAGTSEHVRQNRVNIAEEFYLEVTERPDVREVLRRLANL